MVSKIPDHISLRYGSAKRLPSKRGDMTELSLGPASSSSAPRVVKAAAARLSRLARRPAQSQDAVLAARRKGGGLASRAASDHGLRLASHWLNPPPQCTLASAAGVPMA